MSTFTVYMSGEVELDAEDFWNGEGAPPDDFTAKDAAAAMRAYGEKITTLRQWALLDNLAVSVDTEDVWG